jgi:hypothetical protein
MTKIIDVKLTITNTPARLPCYVCGGCTEAVRVLAEATDENGAITFRVCESCLKDGDIDARLAAHAAEHEAEAARVRALIARVKAPTYAQWQAMSERDFVAHYAAKAVPVVTFAEWSPEERDCEYERVMSDDAAFALWRARLAEYYAGHPSYVWPF